jgi:hypothetical protein
MEGPEAVAGFDTYKDAVPRAKLTHSREGVLEAVLHTNGSTVIFNRYSHDEFVELFYQINPLTPWRDRGGARWSSICVSGRAALRPETDRRLLSQHRLPAEQE